MSRRYENEFCDVTKFCSKTISHSLNKAHLSFAVPKYYVPLTPVDLIDSRLWETFTFLQCWLKFPHSFESYDTPMKMVWFECHICTYDL